MIKVMKFGGTSLGSVDAMERTASIIGRDGAKKIVVVSAMSGVTNSLIGCIRDRPPIEGVLASLRDRYSSSAKMIMSPPLFAEYGEALDSSLDDLRIVLNARWKVAADPLLDDAISSWGERLSSLTMAYVLRSRGVDSVPLTSEKAGIVAQGTPGNGSADLDATHRNLRNNVLPLLEKHTAVVLTGYYGCDEHGACDLRPRRFRLLRKRCGLWHRCRLLRDMDRRQWFHDRRPPSGAVGQVHRGDGL